jgi:hypothetical protein
MKKINQICTLAGVCLSLLSCSEFLTENPYSSISSENFYKTSDDAFAGLNAVYASFRGYYGYDVYYQGDISADLATNG